MGGFGRALEGVGRQMEKANEENDVQLSMEQLSQQLGLLESDLEASNKLPKIAESAVKLSHEDGKLAISRGLLMGIVDRALSIKAKSSEGIRYKKNALIGISVAAKELRDPTLAQEVYGKVFEGIPQIKNDSSSQLEILGEAIKTAEALGAENPSLYRDLLLETLKSSTTMNDGNRLLLVGNGQKLYQQIIDSASKFRDQTLKEEIISEVKRYKDNVSEGGPEFFKKLAKDR